MTTNNWNIDTAHSGINFSIRHMVVSKVRGRFAKYSGTLELDDDDLTRSVVEATIDASSIDTGTPQRDDAPALGRLLRRREVSRAPLPEHAHREGSRTTATASSESSPSAT